MALRGTLKDFGIADIFQLIAHQTKTGVLNLKNRDSDVKVSFKEGNVVKVESTTRQKKELLGAILVRAEVLTEAQLDEALEEQKRSLRRLGDVLQQRGWVRKEQLNEFTRLQATETIYRLFTWENGTYEFEQNDTQSDPDFGDPMRAESVLMEGFRMVDEWPMIRKKITGYGMRFAVEKSLPDAPADELNLDDAFGEMEGGPKKPKNEDEDIGESERKIHSLVESTRDVQKLIDLSRIGEFETCKALSVLLKKGYIRISEENAPQKSTAEPIVSGGLVRDRSLAPTIAWSALGLLVVVSAVTLAVMIARSNVSLLPRTVSFSLPPAVELVLARAQRERIARALEALRLDEGKYPDSLDALVTAGFLEPDDVTFPGDHAFIYKRTDSGYELTAPLP